MRYPLRVGVVTAVLLAGCSGPEATSTPPEDMALPADSAMMHRAATDHPPLPQLRNSGGATIPEPEVWTVAWQQDEAVARSVDEFHAWLLKSAYWTQSLAEYGIRAGTSKGVIVLPDPPPPTLGGGDFDALVAQAASASGHVPTANTLYAFIVPRATAIPGLTQGGFHSATPEGVCYSFNLQPAAQSGSATPFDQLTVTLSHEEAEAATDARPSTGRGWFADELGPILGEVGDLCELAPFVRQGPKNYLVTRLYSNQVAAKGVSDPCVPAPAGVPYSNVAVDPTHLTITTDAQGHGTATVLLEPFAFGDVGAIDWKVLATPAQGGGTIRVMPDQGTVHAGDTVPLTLVVDGVDRTDSVPFFFAARDASGHPNGWPFNLTVR